MKVSFLEQDTISWRATPENKLYYVFGFLTSHTKAALERLIDKGPSALKTAALDGAFAIVIRDEAFTLLITDRFNSKPIYKITCGDTIFLSLDFNGLARRFDEFLTLDERALSNIEMSGFTVGERTIYNEVKALRRSSIYSISTTTIHRISSEQNIKGVVEIEDCNASSKLLFLLRQAMKKCVSSINGRRIIVPLSAGNDSRLVLSLLIEIGYTNIISYTYGTADDFEVSTARLIAKKLNIEWHHVDLDKIDTRAFFSSERYERFVEFSNDGIACPCIQSLLAIDYLFSKQMIKTEDVVFNGSCGDFISGGHISEYAQSNSETPLYDAASIDFSNYIDKHFSLWRNTKDPISLLELKAELLAEAEAYLDESDRNSKIYLFNVYESLELNQRQIKYVLKAQKVFEFYGLDWRVPLWDHALVDFFSQLPLRLKYQQSLYVKTINKYNFQGLWSSDFPVNKKYIRPRWLIPIRFITKIWFFIFRHNNYQAWSNFERTVFYYWRDNSKMIRCVDYFTVLRSLSRGPRHHVSFLACDYITNLKNRVRSDAD